MFDKIVIIATSVFLFTSCSSYKLIPAGTTEVASNSFHVTPSLAWNRLPGDRDDPFIEQWTLNGTILDELTFVGGVADGKPLVTTKLYQKSLDMPVFHLNTSLQDMASLLEWYYSDSMGLKDFAIVHTESTNYMGQAMQVDFRFTGLDDVNRRGRAVWIVLDSRLFMMMLAGTNEHYFDAALPEFLTMVASAELSRIK